jgi:LmbE family N-acetylglucosaminyl deacetylase
MKLTRETAEIYVPSGLSADVALARTAVLGVAAHQDDLEIMATEGVLNCFGRSELWFTGVVMTDGAGSPRDGLYQSFTDEQMQAVRREEQRKAARVGEYSAVVQLDHPSASLKSAAERGPVSDLVSVVLATQPVIVYTHNLADKHDTHVAVALRLIAALRELTADQRPDRVLGCEVWRGLDWMVDEDKVAMNVSSHESLQAALLGVFDSQICGGKRYDLATLGRRRANATYAASHATDTSSGLIYAMDLTPLVVDPTRDVASFVQERIDRLARDVAERLRRLTVPA